MTVQNTTVLESDWRELDIWSRSSEGCRGAGLDDYREPKSCSVLIEELYG
jgi:hypothetical protein